jgi:dolichol-phosphate mannosyltransferase
MHMNGKTRLTAGESSALTQRVPAHVEHERKENLIIIPTYNEAINLKLLVPSILRKGSFDVLIVDDNSPDGTGAIAEEFSQRFPSRVDVLHRSGKLGLGTAYLAGFRYALLMGYQRIFTMDADFSHDPSYLPALRAALEEADVVLGSRYVPGGGTLRWPLRRRLLSRGGSAYARLMLGMHIRDLTGGFKGFRRQVLEALMPELDAMRSNGYAFQIEVTYLCLRHGFRIKEVPIVFEERLAGKSKMNQRIMMEALQVVWALRLNQGSARTLSNIRPRAQLARQRLMVTVMALGFLLIFMGAVILVPQWVAALAQGGSAQQASLSTIRPAPSPSRRSMPIVPPATRVPARARTASLQLQGTNLTPNVPLHFVGSGFLPGEALGVTIQDQTGRPEAQLLSIIADQTGHTGAATEAIPANLPPGTHMLLVQGERSHRLGQASFQVHWIPPAVQLDTYTVKPGHNFGFAGGGFMPGEIVEVHLGSPVGERLAEVRANAGGNVAGSVMAPPVAAGDYTLFFVGHLSQTPAAVGLNVQGFHPWVTLDTYAPSPHTRLGFAGADFASGEEVLVYLNRRGGKPVVLLHADTSGRISAPAVWEVGKLSGENTLIFVGQRSGAIATTTFTVTR